MSHELLYIIISIISVIVGVIIGVFITKTRSNGSIQLLKATMEKQQQEIKEYHLIKEQYDALRINESDLKAQIRQKIEAVQEYSTRINKYEEQIIELNKDKSNLAVQLAQETTQHDQSKLKYADQQKDLEKLNEKFTKEFENLANKILEEKSSKFTDQNKKNIEQILSPLQDKIKTFEKRVEDTHKDTIDRQSALRQQIIGLKELNEQMSKETSNLTKALKGDAKMRGNWGELVLERVLEKSGLEKGSEYEIQQSFKTEDGKTLFPDVIINLPGNKKMIIDSKVSLVAYEQYVNEENDDLIERHLKAHLFAIKKHVADLSAKNYHDLYRIESPDFVLLFIPIEPAFAAALHADNSLYNDAFSKNIVIVTPTTLLATLRTIDTMWQNEKQHRNAIDIANAAGGLYDKFVGLSEDLIKVGSQLETVQKTYKSSMNKLTEGSGNLIGRVERLKKLGAKANKSQNEQLVARAVENDPDYLESDLKIDQ